MTIPKPRLTMPLTIRADVPMLGAIEVLANESGATRHAVLVSAVRRGLAAITADELREGLPAYRRRARG